MDAGFVCTKAAMPRDTIKGTPVYKKRCMCHSVLAGNSIDRQNYLDHNFRFRHGQSTTDKNILHLSHNWEKVAAQRWHQLFMDLKTSHIQLGE